MDTATISFIASLLTSLATGVGALPILIIGNSAKRLQRPLMGFGCGVMLASIVFSLVITGMRIAVTQGYSRFMIVSIMVTGSLIGWYLFWLMHRRFFDEHSTGFEQEINRQKIGLFILAIALHNLPEGLIIGVGFYSNAMSTGTALATGVGLQDIPEGLVVALSLRALGYSATYAVGVSFLTSLVEPVGCLMGISLVRIAQSFLPWGLALVAGAMLFTLIKEIIPELYNQDMKQETSSGLVLGFVLMAFLDIILN